MSELTIQFGQLVRKYRKERNMSQEQLALLLKCSRQTINQELHLLEQQGVLKIAFKVLTIEIFDTAILVFRFAVLTQAYIERLSDGSDNFLLIIDDICLVFPKYWLAVFC